ncbi:hypothetical protein MVEG_05164 [Podila verticillata NRRL 6337]|nr:MAG: hypothetical protein BYD32DRAFT_424578 [Podila humilis]KFH68346.1 hypothetical protein MVEG_05164 [Podila verticillata NRRL 6337]
MREPNFSFPGQNRAAICVTSSIYDRRALDCTDYIPIINTLTNLAYLTGSTPTIREFITRDGGLERLVTILKSTKVNDRKNGLKWTLAFQCVVNVGVRGTEQVRKRVVQAGMVPVIVNVLESFFAVLKSVSDERKRAQRKVEASQSRPMIEGQDTNNSLSMTMPFTAPMDNDNDSQPHGPDSIQTSANSSTSSIPSTSTMPSLANPSSTNTISTSDSTPVTLEQPSHTPVPTQPSQLSQPSHPTIQSSQETMEETQDNSGTIVSGETRPTQFFYREDDILHSLQLLAYLSKYPSLRSAFHTDSGSNVFAIVEKFTHRAMHPPEIQYWAGVIMRNACRKDDTRKGIRQCAYTGCGKWETKPREFAKCRRCRKAKYCSKQCQSKAWNEGHRWWCVEKKAETMGVSTSFGTDLPPAPPPPPPPADLQDQPETNLMENGSIPSVASGAGRMIGGDGGSTGHNVSQHQHHHHHQLQQQQQQQPQQQQQQQQQQQHQQPQQSMYMQQQRPYGAHAPQPSPYQSLHSQLSQNSQPQSRPYGAPQVQQPPQQLPQQQRQQQWSPPSSSSSAGPSLSTSHPSVHPSFSQRPSSLLPQSVRPLQAQPPVPQQRSHPHQHPQQPAMMARAPVPARSSTLPNPSSTAPGVHPRHLGYTPDSPTPEVLAQRFVQQVALHPGQHNELAQQLNAQFQQHFPPHNQAEAKRLFSVYARDHFARYQRQQELLRSGQRPPQPSTNGHRSTGIHSAPIMPVGPRTHYAPYPPLAPPQNAPTTGAMRRRSDLDSDDEDSTVNQSGHSTSMSMPMSVPMLTQDLSSNMTLTSNELSGPLPLSPVENRFPSGEPSFTPTSSTSTDSMRENSGAGVPREFKIRKLMTREESIAGSSSSQMPNNEGLGGSGSERDEWSYSRQMAKTPSGTAP